METVPEAKGQRVGYSLAGVRENLKGVLTAGHARAEARKWEEARCAAPRREQSRAEKWQECGFLGNLSCHFTLGSYRTPRRTPSAKDNVQLNKVKVFFI